MSKCGQVHYSGKQSQSKMSMVSFFESLESNQLADWLEKKLKQRKLVLKDKERQALIDEEINGAAFMLLSEDDLKDLGFTMGPRRLILEIINSTQQAEDGLDEPLVEVQNPDVVQKTGGRIMPDWSEPTVVVPHPEIVPKTGRRIMSDWSEPTVEVQRPEIVQNRHNLTRPSSPALEMRHSFDISQALKNLTDDDIIEVGKALGLNGVKLQRKRTLPSDMVDCWLRQEDNVISTSGDPTRTSLADALEMVGHEGTAKKVRSLNINGRSTARNMTVHSATSFNSTAPSKPCLNDRPTIGQLYQFPGTKLRIISSVAPKWKQFGLLLEFDEQGFTLDSIARDKNTILDCCTEMFQQWLRGAGIQPVTWDHLISLLEDNGLRNLACDLEEALNG